MGFLCCGGKKSRRSTNNDVGNSSNGQSIDAELRKQHENSKSEMKLLLLGSGQSGKTTILKQMKLIHDGGFTAQEKIVFRTIIHSNIFSSIRTLIGAMMKLGIPYENEETAKENISTVLEVPVSSGNEIIPTRAWEAIRAIWMDKGVINCYKKAGVQFQLVDSIEYFMEHYDRISCPDFIPNDQDVLFARTTTTGITETTFAMGDMTYRMFDVGGQRSERRKWIYCFENVTALIFLVAISEYNMQIVEDNNVNRMQEALTLFDSVCNSRWFNKTSFILFMNKIDRFREKINEVPISDYFSDYMGGADYEEGCEYFKSRFLSLNQNTSKQIYVHYTCATDTKQIRFVMSAVNDIIIRNTLRQAGLL